jgi:hypothetical protein
MECPLNPEDFKMILKTDGDVTLKQLCRVLIDHDSFFCTIALPDPDGGAPTVHVHVALCPTVASQGLVTVIAEYLQKHLVDK